MTVTPGAKTVVLASGGIDSSTVLALARRQGYEIYALTFDYGQRHQCELAAARRVVCSLGARQHILARIDLRVFGGSALTADLDVPKGRLLERGSSAIPVTYVPARNTIFLSYALGWCEVLGAQDIFIGANAVDYSGYPDCRPAYIRAFEMAANPGTKAGDEKQRIRIRAPLVRMTKADIIRTGMSLDVDYGLTMSCYDPSKDGRSCGSCDSCVIRKKGFREAGVPDPTPYANS
jgi:7-cyano-7-deazaguanine synthase